MSTLPIATIETPHPEFTTTPDVTMIIPITTPKAEYEEVVAAFGRELDRLGRTWE
jgi:hypothetical protein